MNAQHSSQSDAWYTPMMLIDKSKELMGGIELDPCTSDLANKFRTQAVHYYTAEDNGLHKSWLCRSMLLNPPGGKTKNKSNQVIWWDKLWWNYQKNIVREAIFVGFSLEILAKRGDQILDCPFCIPNCRCIESYKEGCVSGSGRLRFDRYDEKAGEFVTDRSPTHGNVIVYLPPKINTTLQKFRFEQLFGRFGKVVVP